VVFPKGSSIPSSAAHDSLLSYFRDPPQFDGSITLINIPSDIALVPAPYHISQFAGDYLLGIRPEMVAFELPPKQFLLPALLRFVRRFRYLPSQIPDDGRTLIENLPL